MKLTIALSLSLFVTTSFAEEMNDQKKPENNTATEVVSTKTDTATATATAAALPTLKTECKANDKTRRVWISYQNEAGENCKVHYTKPGETEEEKVLWRAQQDPSFCQQKAKEFIEKQKGWNFECAPATY